ncbi:zinc-dependent alcohol dehydrogenase [Rhodococcus opacus]|uniref:zinc-dependent alcohol dehydrogenase n=1 Tax=Rhodococcus opacus TaxID=37919 RepID=UPI001F5AAEAA|nr:zinc-binding dehydrogenase [Rhodococcus opacus]UNN04927.1 zinc-binding dehydrogenase [Rhodococcus opacus]
MRAAIFRGPGDLRIEEIPEEKPGPGEISVAVHAAATCGTDLKSYRRGHPKLFPTLPARFGHEFAGVIDAVGEGVEGFEVGQRVVAANSAPCGGCWACTKQRPSLCENLSFLNGAFAEQVVIPAPIVARNTYVLPDSVSFASAAPLEPLSTVVHGMAEADVNLGDTVVVHGCGPIGLMFVKLSRLRGARVIATDRSSTRLAQAKESGADEVVDLTAYETTAERSAAVRELTEGGRGADIAIEAVGLPEVWEQTVESLRPGGTAVLFGGPKAGSRFSVDAVAMHYSEYTLKGVFHHTPQYVKTALDLLSSNVLDGESLISEVRPLEALVDSLEDMAAGRGAKYLLDPFQVA